MSNDKNTRSLKESATSQDLIDQQKNILRSILEQSRQPSAGAGLPALPAGKPKFTLNDDDHHFDDPPPLTPFYSASANVQIKKSNNSNAVQTINKTVNVMAPPSPSTSLDETSSKYLETFNEAKEKRQTWQHQKSVRSYVPSLSIICKFLKRIFSG